MNQKLTAVWRVLTSDSFQLLSQSGSGKKVKTTARGRGDIQDMILAAVALKNLYNEFVDVITETAIEGGELHALQEIKKAVGVLEKTE